MSFDIPSNLTQEINKFAQTEHISTDEALVTLVRSGLKAIELKKDEVEMRVKDNRLPLDAASVSAHLDRLKTLGPVTPLDTPEERKAKLQALFALSDAAISEGMETWSSQRIQEEVAEIRGTNNQNLY
jgi:hypothetical protein